jgi:glycosyltransferase involved in cell wall biosynthesis
MKKEITSIIIPVYNEKDAVRFSLDKILAENLHDNFEIIFVDDGSDDLTPAIIKDYPVKIISHSNNMGYGAAIKTGIRKASGKKIILMDGDGQHDPKFITEIDHLLDEYDMVIGERSAESYQIPQRKYGKRIVRWIGEYLVEQKLPDFNSGFRGFHKEPMQELIHLMPNGFSFSTTSTLAYIKEGYNIKTIPIIVSERIGRKSSVRFFKDGAKTIMLILRIIMLFNPLKVFLPASIAILFIGFGFGLYGYFVFSRFSNSATILIMLGILLFFVGLLADQISIMNRKKS